MEADVVVVGAGLAGLVAAARLRDLGVSAVLIDSNIQGDKKVSVLGGFARFSGAKFSLPPAGLGLVEVAGGEAELGIAIDAVAAMLGLDFSLLTQSLDQDFNGAMGLRKYDSLILTPSQIDALLKRIEAKLRQSGVVCIDGFCEEIMQSDGVIVKVVRGGKLEIIRGRYLFYAGGRMESDILLNAGILPTSAKGIDLGVRVEFDNLEGLEGLRRHGPDAKIIHGQCRTFCLNVPGNIFRYPFAGGSIPGGVVAEPGEKKCNVGILYRAPNKSEFLQRINNEISKISKEELEAPVFEKGAFLVSCRALLVTLYGERVVDELQGFGEYLSRNGLIDWRKEHYIHMPLLDWHWNTFSKSGSFKTSSNHVYCLGDSSGHARGLLQAAVSGWLAAEEYRNEIKSTKSF